MARNTALSLGEHFELLNDRQIAGCAYETAADIVRAGLRLLDEQEAHRQALRMALDAGEASGAFEPFEMDRFFAEMHWAAEH